MWTPLAIINNYKPFKIIERIKTVSLLYTSEELHQSFVALTEVWTPFQSSLRT